MATTTLSLGEKVLAFARRHRGSRVGDGECATLAERALQHAGAKTTHDYGREGEDDDYQWGDEVNELNALPGDVIQFRNVVIVTKTLKKNPNGATDTLILRETIDHHTAIIARVDGSGSFRVLEQNADNTRVVKENTLNLANKTQGSVWFYRPVPK